MWLTLSCLAPQSLSSFCSFATVSVIFRGNIALLELLINIRQCDALWIVFLTSVSLLVTVQISEMSIRLRKYQRRARILVLKWSWWQIIQSFKHSVVIATCTHQEVWSRTGTFSNSLKKNRAATSLLRLLKALNVRCAIEAKTESRSWLLWLFFFRIRSLLVVHPERLWSGSSNFSERAQLICNQLCSSFEYF